MRVVVLGTSGSGKSTFARRLARATGIRHIELDAINWQQGWRDLNSHEPDEFYRRVEREIGGERWICDGNYSRVRDLVIGRATHLVWLNYSRRVTMGRVLRRSFTRALTREELWPGTGNRETFGRWLQKDHPIRWAWDTYNDRRVRYARLFNGQSISDLERHEVRHPKDSAGLLRALEAQAAVRHSV